MLLLMYQPSYWCVSILLESCALCTMSNDVHATLNLKIIHLAEVLCCMRSLHQQCQRDLTCSALVNEGTSPPPFNIPQMHTTNNLTCAALLNTGITSQSFTHMYVTR